MASGGAAGQLSEHLLAVAMDLLEGTRPQFISENNTQNLRQLLLEVLYRLPFNDHMKSVDAFVCFV